MRDPFARHNQQVRQANEARKRAHTAPESVTVPVDLEELVKEYNRVESEQKARLEQLLGACMQPGGPRRVEFGADAWTNIHPNDRFDIAVGRYVDRLIAYITNIE